MRRVLFVTIGALASCGGGGSDSLDSSDPVVSAACTMLAAGAKRTIASATASDEYALQVYARAASRTHWSQAGNEALILEVSSEGRFIGHLVLHAGADGFQYAMSVGSLAAGATVDVEISSLSARSAVQKVCIGAASLTSATSLGASGEGLVHAPVLLWPTKKRFDDLPMILGWSARDKGYQLVYTNENGGTTVQCGSGPTGMRAELARWGRGADIEGIYSYGGAKPRWERCTGTLDAAPNAPRLEGAHPILYYGDGHNRLFESRGGYGQTCGTGGPEKADGDIEGWNVDNPGNTPEHDPSYTVTIRPLPVALDPLDYASFGGRREGLLDRYAPWIYRITFEELAREGKIDNSKTLSMERYLYADVHAADVGGSGDRVCAFFGASGGFVLRAKSSDGKVNDGPQMTADYFGGANTWKRLAIPLASAYAPADIRSFIFDAYDNDGIYFLELGDAFVVRSQGDNSATLSYVHKGNETIDQYVDDDRSGCVNGFNTGGPAGGPFPCAGSLYEVTSF
jgi:hypothetical protein